MNLDTPTVKPWTLGLLSKFYSSLHKQVPQYSVLNHYKTSKRSTLWGFFIFLVLLLFSIHYNRQATNLKKGGLIFVLPFVCKNCRPSLLSPLVSTLFLCYVLLSGTPPGSSTSRHIEEWNTKVTCVYTTDRNIREPFTSDNCNFVMQKSSRK